MRLRRVAWLAVSGALLWLAPAAAVELKGIGSEAPVGANATGEACRLRVVQEEPAKGTQRLNLYCDGWSVPSGTLFRFRVSAGRPPSACSPTACSRGATRHGWTGCGAIEPTTLGDGTPAAFRQCARLRSAAGRSS